MNDKKTLTQNGLTIAHTVLIFVTIAMIAVSIYLTNQYSEKMFPTSLGSESSLCNINSFFNCDSATSSPASNIAGVPISFLGMMVGIFLLIGSIFPSDQFEKTSSVLTKLNFIGCVVLFLYSLIVLKTLCPMCTLYYVLSGTAFFLFAKYSFARWEPDYKTAGGFILALGISSGFVFNHYNKKIEKRQSINRQIVMQFFALQDLGDPVEESPYKIATSATPFSKAPIRISIFSDFQCPFCAKEAEQMNDLAKEFAGKINIQYFFYPLDKTCNEKIKGNFHQYACAAANLAACGGENFKAIHDEIFNNQPSLSFEMLGEMAKKYKVEECYKNNSNLAQVLKSMEIANNYNIKSTPTLILNGKKIEGAIANDQFKAIFNGILEK